MIQTSAEYRAAIVGSPRRIEVLTVIDISDPDMQYGAVTMDSTAPWSKPEELRDKVLDAPARYVTLERGRWLLDGSFGIFPDDYQVPEHMGVCNNTLSGEDGSWPEDAPARLEVAFSNVSVLQAFSLFFSTDPVDGVPADFTVEVLTGDTAYFSKTVTGNTGTEAAFEGFTVYNPDSIRLTVTRWNLPGRRMRIVDVIPGIYERWGARMLASFTCVMQGDFSCLSLPYGTLELAVDNHTRRFEPRSKNGLFQSIEERQGVETYIGVRTASGTIERCKLGVFYQIGDGWRTGDNGLTIGWSLADIVGLLSNRTFLPPDPLPTTLEGWIAAAVAQLGENFAARYHVDPDYADTAITAADAAAVTDKRCGDIVRWSCMAAGVWPRADQETGYLAAEPLWNQGNKVTLPNLTGYPVMRANTSLAALIFKLADGSNTEFVVSGNTTASEETATISNPFIHTQAQALTAAKLILSTYGGNVLETTGRGDPSSEIGDVDTIWLDESRATTARRMMQTFSITGGALQGCRSKLIQADGSFLFESRAVITQSGTWTAPAGVSQLRLILVGKGSDGADGTDGTWNEAGTDGADGVGGKVWAGTISINQGQQFAVDIGEDTVFGAYSSANGARYENGYTDVASGDSFGRTGVKAPVAGSGDGGRGGDGGARGVRYRETTYDDEGKPSGSRWKVVSQPGDGQPGVAGVMGCAVVYWDKEDA